MTRDTKRNGKQSGAGNTRRYTNRTELRIAAGAEAGRRYEALFGKPWDAAQVAELKDWLARNAPVDGAARDVLVKLTDALDAARRFFDDHPVVPVEQREKREGLRVELTHGERETTFGIFLDPGTLPPDAPVELREQHGNVLLGTESVPTMHLLLGGWSAHVEWQPNGPASVPSVPFELRYNVEPPDLGGSTGLFLRLFVRSAVESLAVHMDRVRPLLDLTKRLPSWESRLAVVAMFDREYAPTELHERRSANAPPARLTDTELAAASILWGNATSMPDDVRGWTEADVIDREAKHIAQARETLETYRAAGFPLPRALARTKVVEVDDPQGVSGPAASQAGAP